MRIPRRLDHGDRITLVEHLDELRNRLVISLAGMAVAFGVAYGFRHHIIGWLNDPLNGREPITFGVAEPFMTSLMVSVYAALAVSLPLWLWQLWSFLAPAFEKADQKAVARMVAFGTVLFAGGACFAYFVVLPAAIPFLLGYDSDIYNIQVRARDYYSFAGFSIMGVGLLFELPVFILGFVRLGILRAEQLRKNRRIGIAVLTAISVALPGVDPITTIMQTVPLLVLFEASIHLARIFERRWERQRRWLDEWDEAGEPVTSES